MLSQKNAHFGSEAVDNTSSGPVFHWYQSIIQMSRALAKLSALREFDFLVLSGKSITRIDNVPGQFLSI